MFRLCGSKTHQFNTQTKDKSKIIFTDNAPMTEVTLLKPEVYFVLGLQKLLGLTRSVMLLRTKREGKQTGVGTSFKKDIYFKICVIKLQDEGKSRNMSFGGPRKTGMAHSHD